MQETEETLRQAVVFAALFEWRDQKFVPSTPGIGPRRMVPMADKERVLKIWRAVMPPGTKPPYPASWCGAFCLFDLKQAGLAPGVFWHYKTGFVEPQHLPRVLVPEPGDVAYYDRPYQHHALVELVDGLHVHTIDGNQPAIERYDSHDGKPARLLSQATHYYSIKPLIDQRLAQLAQQGNTHA